MRSFSKTMSPEEQLDFDYDAGLITFTQYTKGIRRLQQELREETYERMKSSEEDY